MRHEFGLPGGRLPQRRPRRSALFLTLCAALGALAFVGLGREPAAPPAAQPAVAEAKAAPKLGELIAPQPVGVAANGFGTGAPAEPAWRPADQAATVRPAALPVEQTTEPPQAPFSLVPPPVRETTAAPAAWPLPLPRPADLAMPRTASPRLTGPAAPRRARTAAATAPVEDNRNFIQKLFGVGLQPSGPTTALAYAAPQDEVIDRNRPFRLSPSAPPAGTSAARTAVYDITARTLYMPNGERLEAHSGFGEKMDDPRFVHVRMKGATPPHVYDLTEREALFHGHRAVRMHPQGGSGAIFGRAGLLVHPYLLGPRGDSNGCISVRDYDRFLQAYLRGEVKRIVVVAGGGSSRVAALNPSRD